MAKIIVTGGAGFIGSHLVDTLIEKGEKVIIIDNLSGGVQENINPKAEFHQLDLRNLKDINPLFKGIDFVFHLAARPRIPLSIKDPIGSNENNLNATLNVLVAARDAKVKKVIYSSSSSVYGNPKGLPTREDMPTQPLNPYGLQKYVGELYCRIFSQLYELPTLSLRYFNVFGSRAPQEGAYATVIGIFLGQKKEGKPLTVIDDGEQSRDFTYIKDVIRANILAMESKSGDGEAINIGAGNNRTINQLVKLIGGEAVHLPPRPGEAKHSLADISLAKKILNWQPEYNLETGLAEMIKNNGEK
ncbi:MAG: NAD-dependent epimerase/dehydratase family protein [Candidatus Nealsonbacteria bacterium]|nr:NAD-dependent epimerase/dehydratase family protein [Candidatus Nealsonbacteria bacterium]